MKTPAYVDVFTRRQLPSAPAGNTICLGEGPAEKYLVGPALFDPQVNGFAGVDFQDPALDVESLEWAVEAIGRAGCSHILLTLISESGAFLEAQAGRVRECLAASATLRRCIAGIHLEGPFLSPREGYAGAHPREHLIPPSWPLFERVQLAAGGAVRMVTLAPELPGAIDFIERATASGVYVAVGHTDASMEELAAAVRAGARLATHLGNGCPSLLPRHDNIIQRVLATPELLVTLIPDGNHIPPPALRNMIQLLGPHRLAMTTDSMSAAASPPGQYRLGELELNVGEDGIVMKPGGTYFAGSSLRMVDGLLNCMRFGGLDAAGSWLAWTNLRNRLFPHLQAPALLLPFQ